MHWLWVWVYFINHLHRPELFRNYWNGLAKLELLDIIGELTLSAQAGLPTVLW